VVELLLKQLVIKSPLIFSPPPMSSSAVSREIRPNEIYVLK